MDEQVIEQVLNQILKKYTFKCSSPKNTSDGSNAPRKKQYDSLKEAVSDLSEKYGFTIVKNNKSSFTIHDDRNDVTLDFTSGFINSGWNPLDYHNNNSKDGTQVDIEDLFKAYSDLPDALKENCNLMRFEKKNIHTTDWNGVTELLSKKNKEGLVVTLPDFLFQNATDRYSSSNFMMVMAHELTHTMDMPHLTRDELDSVQRYYGKNRTERWGEFMDEVSARDIEVVHKYDNNHISVFDEFSFTYGEYSSARAKNTKFQIDNGYLDGTKQGVRSKSSDYGGTLAYEDTAECGAMVACGFRNPNNPYAKLKLNGKDIQYKDWIKMNPYTAQVMVKRIFGEDVSVDYLLNQGN